MRLIDADKLIENHFSDEHNIALSYANKLWMRRIINSQPTVDAIPIVRCKDCIWRGREECAMFYRFNCGEQHTWETDNDFCSYGESR